jgi:glycosyltransferase involved in cell wall biosynthesis
MNTPALLYISPVIPAPTGGGLAMRSFAHIDTFSRQYAVHLLVARPWLGRQKWNEDVLTRCERVLYVPLSFVQDWATLLRMAGCHLAPQSHFLGGIPPEWISSSRRRLKSAVRHFVNIPFDRVHVYRFYMVPLLDRLGEAITARTIEVDVDDIESRTRATISDLYRQNGNSRMAHRLAQEVRKYTEWERQYLPRFDRVFVCSKPDRKALQSKVPGIQPIVLPNVAPNGEPRGKKNHRRPPFVFLFVGSLDYYPNAEGVQHFCTKILPRLRAQISGAWEFRIVGSGLPRPMAKRLRRIPEVQIIGHVPDIRPYYEDADAVVIPLRAGGGTRIKALEAFVCGVPVISTSTGIYGLEVHHGIEAAIADSPESFAQACIQLVEDELFRHRLAYNALQRVRRSYNPHCLRRILLGAE